MIRRTAATLIATLSMLSLIAACLLFVRLTSPPLASQATAPSVSLSAGELAAAKAVPLWSGAIPVINFHDVSNSRGIYRVTPTRFALQLAALKASGFQSVGLKEVRQLVMHEPVNLPAKPVLITFDDGLASQYDGADPILAEYGFRAVAFLPTAAITAGTGTSGYYLSWQQVEMMQASGRWEFGSHTDRGNHDAMTGPQTYGPWLTNEVVKANGARETFPSWSQRTSADLDKSIAEMVLHTGRPPAAMAYPFTSSAPPGNDAKIQPALRGLVAQRFPLAFISSSKPPEAVDALTDPMSLPRFEVSSAVTVPDLLAALTQMVPVGIGQGNLNSWRITGSGGSCTVSGADAIRLVAAERGTAGKETAGKETQGKGTAGSKATADQYVLCRTSINARPWRDYTLAVTVPRLNGTTALVGVRTGGASRAELAIGKREALLRQQVDGHWRVLRRVSFPPLSKPAHWQVTVKGDVVEARCLSMLVSLSGDLQPAALWGAPAFGFIGQGTLTFSGIKVQRT